jgi:sodium-coupled neutral amino acid transporter 9
MKNNENHEHNSRDLALGYMAAGVSYLTIAIIGYFGFRGNGFPQSSIAQNALDMFSPTNPLAFIFRLILFTQMFTVYPMVLYFVRTQFFGFLYGTDYPSKKHIFIMSIVCSSATTLVSSIYPKVGTIVGIVGAFCGLYFVYVVPVCLHIYYSKPGRLDENLSSPNQSVMKIAMNDEEMLGSKKKSISMFRWKIDAALHSLIIVFGLVVVVFQFYST